MNINCAHSRDLQHGLISLLTAPQGRLVLCLRLNPSGRLRLFTLSSADSQQEGSRILVPCSQHRGNSLDLEKSVPKSGQFCR